MVILIFAILVFSSLVLAFAFAFLGWLRPDLLRNKLQSVVAQHHSRSLFSSTHRFFKILVDRIDSQPHKGLLLGMYIAWSIVLNLFSLDIALIASSFAQHMSISEAFIEIDSVELYASARNIILGHVFAAVLGVTFDVTSLFITLALLRHAARAHHLLTLIFHLVIDVLIILVYIAIAIVAIPAITWLVFGSYVSFAEAWEVEYQPYIWDGSDKSWWHYFLPPLIIGASSAIPTLIYLPAISIVLIIKALPRFLTSFSFEVIEKLIDDDKPVPGAIAKFFTASTAVLAALSGIAAAWPA